MTDIQIIFTVFVGFILFFAIISAAVIMVIWRANNLRASKNTCRVKAIVNNIEQQGFYSMYSVVDPQSATYYCYTVKYEFNREEHIATVSEVKGSLHIGDAVEVFIDPEHPNTPFVGGAVEDTRRGIRRAIIVCTVIIACIVIVPVFVWLIS